MYDYSAEELLCTIYVEWNLPREELDTYLISRVGTGAPGCVGVLTLKTCEIDVHLNRREEANTRDRITGAKWRMEARPWPALEEDKPVPEERQRAYIQEIGDVLVALWEAGVDAVAAVKFDDTLLPERGGYECVVARYVTARGAARLSEPALGVTVEQSFWRMVSMEPVFALSVWGLALVMIALAAGASFAGYVGLLWLFSSPAGNGSLWLCLLAPVVMVVEFLVGTLGCYLIGMLLLPVFGASKFWTIRFYWDRVVVSPGGFRDKVIMLERPVKVDVVKGKQCAVTVTGARHGMPVTVYCQEDVADCIEGFYRR